MTRSSASAAIISYLVLNALLAVPVTHAAAGDTGFVVIEQKRTMFQDIERLGSWGLAMPSGVINGESKEITLKNKPVGNYALTVKPPAGAVALIEVYENDVRTGTFESRTALGKLTASGDTLRFSIQYNFKFLGQVSVQTNPSGIPFILKGPDGSVDKGKTPAEFPNRVAGVYSVSFSLPKACRPVLPMSRKLEANGRLAFSSTFSCSALNGNGGTVTPPVTPPVKEPEKPITQNPIRVSLSAGSSEVPAGGTARYAIVVLNRENSALNDLTVEFRYPSDKLAIQGASDAAKSTNLLQYTIVSLPAGARWETAFTGKISDSAANGTAIAATATVGGDDVKDIRIANRSASVQIGVIKELPQTGVLEDSVLLMIILATFAMTSMTLLTVMGWARVIVRKGL